ncbi:sorting nexin-25-like, partial [Strongylocentrotus purpuratus]|uniref:RGS domain-containing protein n=1 Tax=Strongylocentrotus purpuratus TaxID=7668 RepID=A0A7M7NPI0_STRPU
MIQDLKKARGPETDKSTKSSGKANLLRVRNLKEIHQPGKKLLSALSSYLSFLTSAAFIWLKINALPETTRQTLLLAISCKVAKVQCERRLALRGGPEYQAYSRSTAAGHHSRPLHDLRPQRVLTLDEILSDKVARAYLTNFLKKDGKDDLLNFWLAVEQLRDSKKPKDQHMYANEIYQTYLATTSAVKVDKAHNQRHDRLLGSKQGPGVILQCPASGVPVARRDLLPVLPGQRELWQADGRVGEPTEKASTEALSPEVLEKKGFNTKVKPPQEELQTSETSFVEQTMFRRDQTPTSRGTTRQQAPALSNLKSAHSADSKMQQMLEKEIEQLKLEKSTLETYIERTDLWSDQIGKWRADICSAQCSKWVGKMELPHYSRRPFKSVQQQDFLNSSKGTLQKYLR